MLVQPTLTPNGGGEGVCVWILEALKQDYDLSLLTWEAPSFEALNAFFGTSLRASEVRVHLAHPWLPRRLGRARVARRLKHWALLAEARRRREVDLLIAADEESDLGGRGIQYLHFPRLQPLRPDGASAGGPVLPLLFAVYRRAIARATGFSVARMRRNVTVVNSDWTGREVHRLHGIETTTIHPPAVGPFPPVAWSDRADGFVAVGRLVPEKRLELIIDIVRAVRATRPEVSLHLVGGAASDPGYEARIVGHARAAGAWVHLHRDLSRVELARLLGRYRYGLHAMADEHFGMAVAEMVAAGMIPFVPRGGGQVEIVRDERLLWTTPDDAVTKILAVLASPAEQASLATGLTARAEALGPERFAREFRELVRRTIGPSAAPTGGGLGAL
jgi:glycosyltransferase involved in cell wall biosynthesis